MEISKKSVDKAGESLRRRQNDEDALDTLAAWRNKHIYPLNLAFKLLKKQTDKVGNHAIYGQRLKRVNSILHKLERLPETKLSRLQDIGGCRVILSDYDKLRALSAGLKKSKLILPNSKDYITYPKADGYRGIHLIYKCNSKKPEFNGLKIELQLRTKLQHAWATAVEIIDSFEGEKLKIGQGSKDWQEFFYLVADEFASLEKLPVHNNNIIDRIPRINQLLEKLNITHKISAYAAVSASEYNKVIAPRGFLVLQLMIEQSQIRIYSFKNQTEAQNVYIDLEKQYINDPSMNILMVKMDSIKQIKKAYPNYFADSKIFLEKLNLILSK
jgi:putative GTP pyrophosphokinase